MFLFAYANGRDSGYSARKGREVNGHTTKENNKWIRPPPPSLPSDVKIGGIFPIHINGSLVLLPLLSSRAHREVELLPL